LSAQGSRITAKTFPLAQSRPAFNPLQHGKIGNLSASQKMRVFNGSRGRRCLGDDWIAGEKPPERVANALYLEWFQRRQTGASSSRARILS